MKKLTLFALFMFTLDSTAQEDSKKIIIRSLCLQQIDGVKKVFFKSPSREEEQIEIPLWMGEPSEDIELTVQGSTANFYLPGKNAQGETEPKLVASGPIAKSSRQLFFFIPSGKKEFPYRLKAFDDDLQSFPLGSTRLINLTPTRAHFQLGEIDRVLKPSEVVIVPMPKKLNKYHDFSLLIELETKDGKRYNVRQTRGKANDTKRDITVVFFDQEAKKPRANFYPDIPLWLDDTATEKP